MSLKSAAYHLVIGAVGIAIGWALKPDRIKTEVRTVEVVREVDRQYQDVREVVTVIEHPDGTKETVTERTAESLVESETSESRETLDKTEKPAARPQWSIALYVSAFENQPNYIVTVDRRILGNLSLGIYGQTNFNHYQVGAGVRLEF